MEDRAVRLHTLTNQLPTYLRASGRWRVLDVGWRLFRLSINPTYLLQQHQWQAPLFLYLSTNLKPASFRVCSLTWADGSAEVGCPQIDLQAIA